MKQLSNLTKVMFCIVAVLLVITVALGIATAVKDSKANKEGQGNVTPQPESPQSKQKVRYGPPET